MKKIIYIIIPVIFIYSCNDKNSITNSNKVKTKFDTINLLNHSYDTVFRNMLIIKADKFYYKKGNQSLEIYKEIEKKSSSIKDTFGIIYANINLSLYYSNKFSTDSAYYRVTKAEKLSLKLNKNPYLGVILLNKADILWSQKNYSEGEITAIRALKIALNKKRYDIVQSCYITIANSLEGMNKNERAIDYYKKALIVLDNNTIDNKLFYVSQTYNYIAKISQKQNQHNKAIFYVNKGLENKLLKQNDIKIYCYLTNTLSYSKFKLGDKSAVNQFLETLKIGDSLKFAPIQITSKTYLGEYYLSQKDTLKANLYLKQAQKQAQKNNIFEDELTILQLLAKANPNQSTYFSNRYIALNDSLQMVERITRDKFARIEFETDEISTQNITIAKEKDSIQNQLYLILGIAFSAITILVLGFKNKSQKAKTRELQLKQDKQEADEKLYQILLNQQDKIEETKQLERKRISKELHDGIMGKLSGIRMNLYIIKKKTDSETITNCLKYINDIKEIENNLRLLSHDLSTNIFSTATTMEEEINILIKDLKNHSTLQFELNFNSQINWEIINNVVKLNIYRVIQEALHNINKYAKASNVCITIYKKDAAIVVEISDNGIGFNTTKTNVGIGLKNMNERTNEIGGKFTIISEPKNGTKISLIIPI